MKQHLKTLKTKLVKELIEGGWGFFEYSKNLATVFHA